MNEKLLTPFRKLHPVEIPAKLRWYAGMSLKYLSVLLVAALLLIIGGRIGQKKAFVIYSQMLEEYKQEAEQEIAALAALPLSEDKRRSEEAEQIAKVLYGVKDNSTDDLRTLCWCIFNRVDSEAYPNSVSEVVNQPSQWMQYSEKNPIMESLYSIAREELDKWYDGYRPCSNEYVFMSWQPTLIRLRNEFNSDYNTRYWESKQ